MDLLKYVYLFFNKVRSMLETHSTKATAVGKRNNARVCGRISQGFGDPPVQRGFRPEGDFTAFVPKNTNF